MPKTNVEHTPLPYHVVPAGKFEPVKIFGADKTLVCEFSDAVEQPAQENAEFVTKACNSHDALINALQLAYDTLLTIPQGFHTQLQVILKALAEGKGE